MTLNSTCYRKTDGVTMTNTYYHNSMATCEEMTSDLLKTDHVIMADISSSVSHLKVRWFVKDWDCSNQNGIYIYVNSEPVNVNQPFQGKFRKCQFENKAVDSISPHTLCTFACDCTSYNCTQVYTRVQRPLIGAKLCKVEYFQIINHG